MAHSSYHVDSGSRLKLKNSSTAAGPTFFGTCQVIFAFKSSARVQKKSSGRVQLALAVFEERGRWKRSLCLPHFGLQQISSLESFRSSTASIFSTALSSASEFSKSPRLFFLFFHQLLQNRKRYYLPPFLSDLCEEIYVNEMTNPTVYPSFDLDLQRNHFILFVHDIYLSQLQS